jgi:hypothetical protein
MRVLLLLPLLSFASTSFAVPAVGNEATLGKFRLDLSGYTNFVVDQIVTTGQHVLHQAQAFARKGKKNIDRWFDNGKEFILQNGLTCTLFATSQSRFMNIYKIAR